MPEYAISDQQAYARRHAYGDVNGIGDVLGPDGFTRARRERPESAWKGAPIRICRGLAPSGKAIWHGP